MACGEKYPSIIFFSFLPWADKIYRFFNKAAVVFAIELKK